MIRNILKLLMSCLLMLSLFSCESLLDVDVESEITSLDYWQKEEDFQTYLNGIYSYFRSRMDWTASEFGEERSGMWTSGSLSRYSPYWKQVITPDNAPDWRPFYACIGHANILLSKIKSFKFSDKQKKNDIIAQALCLRAATYFHIAKIWGDVPIMLKPVKDENIPLKARAPVKKVFKQINHDIDSALTLFSTKGIPDKYYISKPTAEALKADVCVWQAKVLHYNVEASLKDAIAAIDYIEKYSGASLLNDFKNITVRKNKEIIWSLFESRKEGPMYAKKAFPLKAYSGGADNADKLPIAFGAGFGYATYAVSDLALNLFKKHPNDKRIPGTYITEINHGEPGTTWQNKFRGTVYSDSRFADDDVIMYRLGGILLLKAEAFAALDSISKALKSLNRVRNRAGIPDFHTNDIKKLNKEILDERGRELFFEDKRWYDLVKSHKWGTIDIYQTIPNLIGKTTPIYWAVSTKVMSLNPNITQTPGY